MKPADAPPGAVPAPGAKTFLGWVASGVSRKHLTITAAALCSLAAGIMAVKLIFPPDDFKPDTVTTQAVAPEAAWPEHKPIVPPGAANADRRAIETGRLHSIAEPDGAGRVQHQRYGPSAAS